MISSMKSIVISTLVLVLLIAGCAEEAQMEDKLEQDMTQQEMEKVMEEKMKDMEEKMEDIVAEKEDGWRNAILIDVTTNEPFKISDFKGTPILLESFAVWCPTCRKQQEQIQELHEELGDSFISISINTDPNEDADKVQEYLDRYEFGWRYALSPIENTQLLIDEFGVAVVNAPSAPVVLICEDQTARLMPRGLKRPEELSREMAKGC